MNELKKKWIEALRSGKYEQGKSTLRCKDNKFCCLGVLADLIDPNAWERGVHRFSWKEGLFSLLDLDSIKLAGVESKSETLLWRMNDTLDMTFSQIADVIESDDWSEVEKKIKELHEHQNSNS